MMKSKVAIKVVVIAIAIAAGAPSPSSSSIFAQPAKEQTPARQEDKGQDKKKGEEKRGTDAKAPVPGERLEPDDESAVRQGVSEEALANRVEQRSEEEAAVVSYYNNFFSHYRVGPEDVITVEVFDHPRYSRGNITVPPDGKISYYFVPEGLHVAGRTTQQIAAEITRHLDEYIIDPKVTVTLEKAQSQRFAVLGDVGTPGVRVMTRRLTVYEALLEAGGVLGTGNKKKVVLARRKAGNMLEHRVIDIAAIERGRAPDDTYLSNGDQIFVPGNRMKTVNKVLELLPVISFARIFTGGW